MRPSSPDRQEPSSESSNPAVACAKLVTTNKEGRKQAVILSINKPCTVGRNRAICSYVIADIVVSSIHFKLYAVRSSSGGIIVSCQDVSTNGLLLNGQKIRKGSVILMDGDVIAIPNSQTFKCIHLWKEPNEKAHIFDPTPPTQPSHKRVGRYMVTSHRLGSGSFATVHLAVDTAAHRQVACKSIKTKKENDLGKVMKEVRILTALNHPNINRVYDVELDGTFLHIFLQLCTGGDLFTYITGHINNECRLCEGEAKYIMYQLLKGLKYLHDRTISHRDLKPENLLLHSPGPYPRIQIADFGLARPKAYQETLNVCGTVAYLPPEGILALDHKHLGYVGMPADCWSAGVILFVILSGSHPFDCGHTYDSTASSWIGSDQEGSYVFSQDTEESVASQLSTKSETRVKRRIVNGQMTFSRFLWDEIPHAKALVGRLLMYNPLHRATVYTALESSWITSELDELETAYHERIVVG